MNCTHRSVAFTVYVWYINLEYLKTKHASHRKKYIIMFNVLKMQTDYIYVSLQIFSHSGKFEALPINNVYIKCYSNTMTESNCYIMSYQGQGQQIAFSF